jgi:hypothetical protein
MQNITIVYLSIISYYNEILLYLLYNEIMFNLDI